MCGLWFSFWVWETFLRRHGPFSSQLAKEVLPSPPPLPRPQPFLVLQKCAAITGTTQTNYSSLYWNLWKNRGIGFSKKFDLSLLSIECRVLDRFRAFDRLVSVDAHLCFQVTKIPRTWCILYSKWLYPRRVLRWLDGLMPSYCSSLQWKKTIISWDYSFFSLFQALIRS
jgi:hypothetical protein